MIDEKLIRSLVKKAESYIGPHAYVGVSWRDLSRYNEYSEPGLILTQQDKELTQLYAGLAVLAWDMKQYLAKSRRKDARLFKEVIASVKIEDRKRYGPGAFPYDSKRFPYTEELAAFPKGLARTADEGRPTVQPLGGNYIRHEWTVKPGKKLFLKFGEKFKIVICCKDGPYEQFENGLLGQVALPSAITASVPKSPHCRATRKD